MNSAHRRCGLTAVRAIDVEALFTAVAELDVVGGNERRQGLELTALATKLGYAITHDGERYKVTPPDGRKLAFVGDLVDRGPGIVPTLKLVMDAVADGVAICVPGNHENRLLRHLRGKGKTVTHGLAQTIEQMADADTAFNARVSTFIDGLVSHYAGCQCAMTGPLRTAARRWSYTGTLRCFTPSGSTTRFASIRVASLAAH